MKAFSRYNDNTGRLLIVLACWCKIKEDKIIPTTIDILIVAEERQVTYQVSQFEDWIRQKLVTIII